LTSLGSASLRATAPLAERPRGRPRRRSLALTVVLAGVFALLIPLAFPFRAGDFRFDLGIVAGWLALAPLAALLRNLTPRAAFKCDLTWEIDFWS